MKKKLDHEKMLLKLKDSSDLEFFKSILLKAIENKSYNEITQDFIIKLEYKKLIEFTKNKLDADINIRLLNNNSILNIAIFYQNYDLADFILSNTTIDINMQSDTGMTALMFLIQLADEEFLSSKKSGSPFKSIEIIKSLLSKNPDLNLKNSDNCLALNLCEKKFSLYNFLGKPEIANQFYTIKKLILEKLNYYLNEQFKKTDTFINQANINQEEKIIAPK